MRILILSIFIFLTGCAADTKTFSSYDKPTKWGLDTRHVLFDEDGVSVVASLISINSKIEQGYRIDKEEWIIYLINESKENKCQILTVSGNGFIIEKLTNEKINAYPDSIINAVLLKQTTTYKQILDFEYIGISNATVNVEEC